MAMLAIAWATCVKRDPGTTTLGWFRSKRTTSLLRADSVKGSTNMDLLIARLALSTGRSRDGLRLMYSLYSRAGLGRESSSCGADSEDRAGGRRRNRLTHQVWMPVCDRGGSFRRMRDRPDRSGAVPIYPIVADGPQPPQ
jgi:hypothetical protein